MFEIRTHSISELSLSIIQICNSIIATKLGTTILKLVIKPIISLKRPSIKLYWNSFSMSIDIAIPKGFL